MNASLRPLPRVTPDAPANLMMEVTTECNLRCKQCYLWMEKDGPRSLSTAEKVGLVEEYGRWAGGHGIVQLSGGEALRNPEEVFSLCRAARQWKLKTFLSTNGTLLSPAVQERICTEGPDFLMLSIDAPRAEIHDWIRGVEGTFAKVTEGVRSLRKLRDSKPSAISPVLLVNMLVCQATLPHLLEHIDFVKSLGADAISFTALSRTIMHRGPKDQFFEEQTKVDLDLLDRTIDSVMARKAKKEPGFDLVGEEIDFHWLKQYFRNPWSETKDAVCDSIYRNLIVNKEGSVSLCHFEWEYFQHHIGNVRQHSLRELWTSQNTGEIREQMRHCRKGCGMMNCHREGVAIR